MLGDFEKVLESSRTMDTLPRTFVVGPCRDVEALVVSVDSDVFVHGGPPCWGCLGVATQACLRTRRDSTATSEHSLGAPTSVPGRNRATARPPSRRKQPPAARNSPDRRRMLFSQAVTCSWTPYFHDAYAAVRVPMGGRSWAEGRFFIRRRICGRLHPRRTGIPRRPAATRPRQQAETPVRTSAWRPRWRPPSTAPAPGPGRTPG